MRSPREMLAKTCFPNIEIEVKKNHILKRNNILQTIKKNHVDRTFRKKSFHIKNKQREVYNCTIKKKKITKRTEEHY